MKVAWFDASAGASGDMILGALVDAGLPLEQLREGLAALDVSGWELTAEPVMRRGVRATHAQVRLSDERYPGRHLRHIVEILDRSPLPAPVIAQAKAVFTRLGEAEAKVHGTTLERIHFHEVGAVDAIVDIVGACLGLHLLGVEQISCSPLPVSHGWVQCEHGQVPVPAWATQELLKGVPSRPLDVEGETLTPTGAAVLTTLASSWTMPALAATAIGYGAGTKDFGVPNVLRVVLGETAAQSSEVVVIEANIDDMNPEWWELSLERIFAAGALDATLEPIAMKKGRPAVLLRAVADPTRSDAVIDAILTETTTLGVRYHRAERRCLAREWVEVATPFGAVKVKVGRRGDQVLNLAPEYETCRQCAEASGAPLKEVYASAQQLARALLGDGEGRKAT